MIDRLERIDLSEVDSFGISLIGNGGDPASLRNTTDELHEIHIRAYEGIEEEYPKTQINFRKDYSHEYI